MVNFGRNVGQFSPETTQLGIIEFRNLIAHYFRIASRPNIASGVIDIPINIDKDFTWSDFTSYTSTIKSTIDKLSDDLNLLEETLNDTHKILIIEFERVLRELKIKIDYDCGKIDELCFYCGWYMAYNNSSSADTSSSSSFSIAPASGSLPTTLPEITVSGMTASISNTSPYSSGISSIKKVCQNPDCPNSKL